MKADTAADAGTNTKVGATVKMDKEIKLIRRKIPKQEISNLPKDQFDGRIRVVCSVEEAEEICEYLKTEPVVGVDTETKPSFVKGRGHKVALLQVSTESCCFLFRLNLIGVPPSMIAFFEDSSVVKIGLSLKDDFNMLHQRAKFTPQSWIDLQDFVKPFGIEDGSLQKIYANLFGKKISKHQRLSNWEAAELNEKQRVYAATDAWACYRIYRYLKELKRTGNYEIEEITGPLRENEDESI